ncbi:MAG: 30S ribosomal protein S6 [Alphaproteobacteria bacterium]|nr:30S ribosomal protein S6 [Alphaproteobacteria bacterium]
MPVYETVFIARQDLTENQVKDLTDRFCKVITDAKGKINKTEQWGLRTLAYKINKSRKGHYTLIECEVAGPAIIELERVMRLDEDVMRALTIRLDEATDGPSIMMDSGKYDKKDDKRSEKEAA